MEPIMVYVQREDDPASPRLGKVKGVYRQLQPGYAEEQLAADHADVAEYKSYTEPGA